MAATTVEWANPPGYRGVSWNVVTGCTPRSAGCKNCWARRMAARQRGRNGYPADDPFRVTFHPDKLTEPLHWRKPRTVFVSSMGDLFHDDVVRGWLDQIFDVMASCPQHRFLLLTKRPENAAKYIRSPLENVGLGVTVEHADYRDRIDKLRAIPAAMRFVSAEPLLGEVSGLLVATCPNCGLRDFRFSRELTPDGKPFGACSYCGVVQLRDNAPGAIDWVIGGGESGPGARPMHPAWARSLRDQCQAAGVPYFFKQWGAWVSVSEIAGAGAHYHFTDGATVRRVGKKKAGRLLDGRTWDEWPAPFFLTHHSPNSNDQ